MKWTGNECAFEFSIPKFYIMSNVIIFLISDNSHFTQRTYKHTHAHTLKHSHASILIMCCVCTQYLTLVKNSKIATSSPTMIGLVSFFFSVIRSNFRNPHINVSKKYVLMCSVPNSWLNKRKWKKRTGCCSNFLLFLYSRACLLLFLSLSLSLTTLLSIYITYNANLLKM